MPLTQTKGPRMYFEPKLLVNKLSDQLPPDVDPCQREVGAETAKSSYQFTREMLTPTSSFRIVTNGKFKTTRYVVITYNKGIIPVRQK